MSRIVKSVTGAVLLAGLTGLPLLADTPVGWRNDGRGHYPAATPPTEWSSDKNVLWKVALPGPSYAAPIIEGDRLWVVSDPADLYCIRRTDGKVLWHKSLNDVKAPPARSGGGRRPGRGFGGPGGGPGGGRGGRGGAGNTAATPVSDGKHVAVIFGNGVAAMHTLDGERLWARFIESSQLGFGHASSPLLLGDRLIVHIRDLVALDVATGKEAWRVALSAAHASPVAARIGGEDVVISPSGSIVRASDGKVLVRTDRLSSQSSPVVDGDTVYLFGSTNEALRLEQKKPGGEVSVSRLWSREGARERHHLPSPLVHDGLLYGVTTGGFLEVIEARTGEAVYRQRLGLGQVYSSVTRAGDLLYVVDTRGKAVVFKPGRRFERVAVNQLEGMGSCPVFADRFLYLRGQENLYCLGSK